MSATMRWGWGLLALVGACGPAPEPAQSVGVRAAAQGDPDSELVAELRADLAARDLELAQLREQPAGDEERQRLRERVAALEVELSGVQLARLEREQEWLRYTRAISALELASVPEELVFEAQVPEAQVPEVPAAEVPEADGPGSVEREALEQSRARVLELQRALVSLLLIEEVYALTLLDVGQLGDGWIGPVLFRINSAGGHLAGGLYAERLYLEGSRAGRTLTLVLEEGYETRGGVRTPFMRPSPLQPGVRRIVLPYLDPQPWAESMPELFASEAFDEVHDDSKWNLTLVRGTLNLLLREDAAGGWYRVRSLGGVTGDVLRDVHLLELDAEGNTRRHLFADRLKISIQDQGVLVALEDGASMKGQQKTPFVAGKLLLYFPRANHAHWIVEDLPLFEVTASAGQVDAGGG